MADHVARLGSLVTTKVKLRPGQLKNCLLKRMTK